jgi:hypothetical protein
MLVQICLTRNEQVGSQTYLTLRPVDTTRQLAVASHIMLSDFVPQILDENQTTLRMFL